MTSSQVRDTRCTRKAIDNQVLYRGQFERFASAVGVSALEPPPLWVWLEFIDHVLDRPLIQNDRKRRIEGPVAPRTADQMINGIAKTYDREGYSIPGYYEIRRRLRRAYAERGKPVRRAAPLTADVTEQLVEAEQRRDYFSVRRIVLVVLARSLAARASNVTELYRDDIVLDRSDASASIRLERTKTSLEPTYFRVRRHENPALSAYDWLVLWLDEYRGSAPGPLFPVCLRGCAGRPIAHAMLDLSIKQLAQRAGLDPSIFSGHSCRRGWATSARQAGATFDAIQRRLQHRTPDQTFLYIDNPEAQASIQEALDR
jgi:hypothetical protein